MKLLIIPLCAILAVTCSYELNDIKSARIESCRGCSLNRLPEVKQFILQDVPEYDRIDVNFITGAPPELVLLGEEDVELERLPLSNLGRLECNELLQSKGFTKKSNKRKGGDTEF